LGNSDCEAEATGGLEAAVEIEKGINESELFVMTDPSVLVPNDTLHT